MKTNLPILLILFCLFSCKTNENRNPLIEYLETNHLSPNEYVIKKFKDHDVIFIGENHYIKEQVEFIKDLIPDLYENGIYNLGTEFLNYEDTELANKLITAEIFDNGLAEDITFKSLWHWGYKEYIDIYRKAWELNKSLPKDAIKFKIFGVQEIQDFSYVKTEEDFNNPEIMNKVFSGSIEFDEEEGYSANAIEKEVLDFDEKALIHCGIHHAFTSYYQPNYNPQTIGFGGNLNKERMGNLIKNKIGNRAITIFLHGSWPSKNGYSEKVLPVDGVIDSIFSLERNSTYVPFGVDTKQTPFGNLKGENSLYKYGYDNFKLEDFCDGYIFLMPINEYKPVTAIPNFISPEQVEYVKSQEFDYRNSDLTANKLNDSIKVWLLIERDELMKMKK
jgi:hypothetical protein